MRRPFLLCLGTIAVAAAFTQPALAAQVVVDNDFADCPSADTNSIELGVEMANPGDTVFVCRGTYNEMVTMEPDDSGIRVRGQNVDEVVLDGQGSMAAGFHLGGVTEVIIERFTVRRYHDDIVLVGADDNVIRRNKTTGAFGHDGILVDNSDRNRIVRNVSFLNQNSIACGISVGHGSTDNVVRHNLTFDNSNVGILIGFPAALGGPAGPGNVVVHNVSRDNGKPVPAASGGTGIFNNTTPGTLIAHNEVRDNNSNGILVSGSGSTGVRIAHNDVVNNGSTSAHDGIALSGGAHDNVVAHNETRLNAHNGIHLNGAADNLVGHNRADMNGRFANGCGIDLTGTTTTGNVVRRNRATRHDRAGIRVRQGASGNEVSRNHTNDNPGHGIHLLDGDGNIVERNHSKRNGIDGIRSDAASSGNTFVRNHMRHNAEHDAHDDNRAANTWIDNRCKTDFPSGTIC